MFRKEVNSSAQIVANSVGLMNEKTRLVTRAAAGHSRFRSYFVVSIIKTFASPASSWSFRTSCMSSPWELLCLWEVIGLACSGTWDTPAPPSPIASLVDGLEKRRPRAVVVPRRIQKSLGRRRAFFFRHPPLGTSSHPRAAGPASHPRAACWALQGLASSSSLSTTRRASLSVSLPSSFSSNWDLFACRPISPMVRSKKRGGVTRATLRRR